MKIRDIRSSFVLLTLFSILNSQESAILNGFDPELNNADTSEAEKIEFFEGWESYQAADAPTTPNTESPIAAETPAASENVEFFEEWESYQAADAPTTPNTELPIAAETPAASENVEFFEGWESYQAADAPTTPNTESPIAAETPAPSENVEFFEGWESHYAEDDPDQTEYFEGWEPETQMADAPHSPSKETKEYSENLSDRSSANQVAAESGEESKDSCNVARDTNEPCSTDITKDTKVIIKETQGLVLVDDERHLYDKDRLKEVSGLQVSHIELPSSVKDLQKKLDPIYRDQPLTLGKIRELKNAINNYFIDSGFPFTMVRVPKQCISTGVLQLIVCQSRLGKVVVEGNCWTRPNLITQYIKTKPGDCIRSSEMTRDVNFMNRNPYRRVNAIYAAGKEPCTTDLILAMEDRKPYRIYAGADNTGPVRIRRQRVFTGLGLSKMFGLDHYLNFQYTSSYNNKAFQGYTGQYVMFFPCEHVLNIFGGYSVITSNLPFPATNNQGLFIQASARYTIPTVISQSFPIEIGAGFDFKRTNTTLLFQETSTPGFANSNQAANLSQFSLDLRSSYQGNYSRIEYVGELFLSPCEMLPDESNAKYSALRPGASPSYIYGKMALRYTQWLPEDVQAYVCLRGQLSNSALLPSEQYGIGGHDTVRGYDEFQLAMDNALNANFEIRSPSIQLISTIRKMPMKDALQFLVFFDYGIGTNKLAEAGERSPSYLMSFGPGFRYTLDPYVAIRFDWGWKLKKAPSDSSLDPYTGGDSMVHFSATLSY